MCPPGLFLLQTAKASLKGQVLCCLCGLKAHLHRQAVDAGQVVNSSSAEWLYTKGHDKDPRGNFHRSVFNGQTCKLDLEQAEGLTNEPLCSRADPTERSQTERLI